MIIRCPSRTHKAGKFKHVKSAPIQENKMSFVDKSFMIIHFIESTALVIIRARQQIHKKISELYKDTIQSKKLKSAQTFG